MDCNLCLLEFQLTLLVCFVKFSKYTSVQVKSKTHMNLPIKVKDSYKIFRQFICLSKVEQV